MELSEISKTNTKKDLYEVLLEARPRTLKKKSSMFRYFIKNVLLIRN